MRFLASSVIVLLGACASNHQLATSDEEYDDLARSLASTLRPAGGGGELGALLDIETITRGGMPAGFAAAADGALYGEHVGLSYRYEMACRDAHNRVLPACDLRTANADARVTWSGVLELPELVLVIERDGSWIVNDITDQSLRIDGEADMTYASTIENPERGTVNSYEIAYEASHRRIVLGRDEPFPRTGTVIYALDVRPTRTAQHPDDTEDTLDLTLTAELQFVAGGGATLELDGARAYELDLETGAIVRVGRGAVSDRSSLAHRALSPRASDATR